VSIPAQVLLDKNGKEFFRHAGYYSSEDLIKEFDKYLTSNNL
jgi:thioredoxin 1